jgi:hypothetical protein
LFVVDPTTGKPLYFVPRILFSTAGVAGAGLDDAYVRGVHRDGYPPSLLDYIQEGGRNGRYPGALPCDNNRYVVNISWKSFCHPLFRIFIVPVLEAETKRHHVWLANWRHWNRRHWNLRLPLQSNLRSLLC